MVCWKSEKECIRMKFSLKPSLRLVTALASVAVVTVLAGCASLSVGSAPPEKQVAERSAAYWSARSKNDFAAAYAFATPAYRKLHTVEKFRMQFGAGVAIRRGEAVKVQCEEQKCSARVKLSTTPVLPGVNLGTIDTYLDEVWLLEDGQWWRYEDL
jgi:hypothetical protein